MLHRPPQPFFLPILCVLLAGTIWVGTACLDHSGNQRHPAGNGDTSLLSMAQTTDGQWVIMDSLKTILYHVFIYDNGPDDPSDGLIRVVKNGKIGYADAQTYAIVIEPQFDCAFPFENGKAKVSNHCKTVQDGEHSVWESDDWTYVDKPGNR